MSDAKGTLKTPLEIVPPSAAVDVGVARCDITPPVGIYARQWGAAKHDVAEGVHRPLSATVLVIGARPQVEPLVLVAMDGTWWHQKEDEWRIRGALIEALGLYPARVMVSVTHTHAAVSLCTADVDKPGGEMIESYLQSCASALLEATQRALDSVRPGVLTWTAGRCDLAVNRDLPDPGKPRILCGYNPSNTADDTVMVGRVCDSSGNVLATLVNYACHPTTLAWDNALISPDFVGAMCEVVELNTGGAPCLFLQGASGELSPAEQYVGDVSIADRHGRRLGFAALAAIESMGAPATALCYAGAVESGAPLAMWERKRFKPAGEIDARMIDVELPLKPLPSGDEVREQLAKSDDRVESERLRRKLRVLATVGEGPTCKMQAWVWRVGQAIIVGQPNEAYSDFQIELRRRFPDYALVVMNLVNGACGYLAPDAAYDEDIYQVWQSPFARGGLVRLIESCSACIEEMIHS